MFLESGQCFRWGDACWQTVPKAGCSDARGLQPLIVATCAWPVGCTKLTAVAFLSRHILPSAHCIGTPPMMHVLEAKLRISHSCRWHRPPETATDCDDCKTSLAFYCYNWLQSVQNAAARLIFSACRRDHVQPLLRSLYTDFKSQNGFRSGWRCWCVTHCLHGSAVCTRLPGVRTFSAPQTSTHVDDCALLVCIRLSGYVGPLSL